jgi:hypothetical protein
MTVCLTKITCYVRRLSLIWTVAAYVFDGALVHHTCQYGDNDDRSVDETDDAEQY